MHCTHCNYHGTIVITTLHNEQCQTYRRRECIKCEKRFTTMEIQVSKEDVIKKYKNNVQMLHDDLIGSINKFLGNLKRHSDNENQLSS